MSMTTKTKNIALIGVAGLFGATHAFANGIADMSGTVFTQQLHASAPSRSPLPAFLIILLGSGLLYLARSMRSTELSAYAQDSNARADTLLSEGVCAVNTEVI